MPAIPLEHLGKKQPQRSQVDTINNYLFIDVTDSRRFLQALWKRAVQGFRDRSALGSQRV
eukprot:1156765-Pelagomonas_calceolata.AAC.1